MTLLATAPAIHADPRSAIVLAGHRPAQRGRAVPSDWGPDWLSQVAEHRRARGGLLTETLAHVTRLVPADRVIVVTTHARADQLLSESEAASARRRL